ncbi:amine dehydrogenase large subunit [Paraburkholderia dinghuensis]|uniref:Amine dehydrogenase n=1 Tax=Paraburkholderia dinghuensis TaxID=2305225 RepID=A0A3N6NJG1_9BURK|nr:amine dehydrogenase large subunit [Paraburkholderia dinghuensis]RQH08987.1 amine dehydrogenase [Paraburkholderia dinghuensis]
MSRRLISGVAVLATVLLSAQAPVACATEKIETITVDKVPDWNPNWIYGIDDNFNTMAAGTVQVYDGQSQHFVGQLNSGFSLDGMAISPDHDTIYVPGIYYSRLTRGTRTDVLDIFDRKTLTHLGEITLPTKHAQSIPTAQDTSISDDGRFVYVSNVTPATSISVVDTTKRQFVGEINTAACLQAYPYGKHEFFSMCPDGSILQLALDDKGAERSRQKSAAFFNVDEDPVFVNGLRSGNKYFFISFNGVIHTVDLSQGKAAFLPTWSLLSQEDAAGNWRPGGYQVGALNNKTGELFVLMHQGEMKMHKEPGTQVWVYDVASHRLLRKLDLTASLKDASLMPFLGIQVSQSADHPLLFGITADSTLVQMDAATGKIAHVEKQFGSSTMQLINQ